MFYFTVFFNLFKENGYFFIKLKVYIKKLSILICLLKNNKKKKKKKNKGRRRIDFFISYMCQGKGGWMYFLRVILISKKDTKRSGRPSGRPNQLFIPFVKMSTKSTGRPKQLFFF